jgi:hypothetical protein
MTTVFNQAQKRCSTLHHLFFVSLVFHVFRVPHRNGTVQYHPYVLRRIPPFVAAFGARSARLGLATTKPEQHTTSSASVHKVIVHHNEFVCSSRCSYRSGCIPKHIPLIERSSRLRRCMSILKVWVCRCPQQVIFARSLSLFSCRSVVLHSRSW